MKYFSLLFVPLLIFGSVIEADINQPGQFENPQVAVNQKLLRSSMPSVKQAGKNDLTTPVDSTDDMVDILTAQLNQKGTAPLYSVNTHGKTDSHSSMHGGYPCPNGEMMRRYRSQESVYECTRATADYTGYHQSSQ